MMETGNVWWCGLRIDDDDDDDERAGGIWVKVAGCDMS